MEVSEIKTLSNNKNWGGTGVVGDGEEAHKKWLEAQEKEDTEKLVDQDDAEDVVETMESPNPEKARESTENGRVLSSAEAKKLLENIPPERMKVIEGAMKYLGVSNDKNPAMVKGFFEHCGDASYENSKTLWCMVFVNQVLSDLGKKGSDSASAKSGLTLGKATETPEPGDLIVVKRAEGNHVGFFLGLSESGNPVIIGGNQGATGEVSIKEETRPIRGYRNIV